MRQLEQQVTAIDENTSAGTMRVSAGLGCKGGEFYKLLANPTGDLQSSLDQEYTRGYANRLTFTIELRRAAIPEAIKRLRDRVSTALGK